MTFTRDLTKEEIGKVRVLEGVTGFQLDKDHIYLLALDAEEEREAVIAKATQALAIAGVVARAVEDGGLLETKYLELTD